MKLPLPRRAPLALCLALACATPALAQVTFSYSTPGVSIGVNLGGYPTLQPIPGYPVYYAPNVNANYFFYDGMYWVFDGNAWYTSSWYNGPWGAVDPYYVPDFILRVPVRYYRHPPTYFRSWRVDSAPHWNEHWGRSWEDRRHGWDRWDRRHAPAPAPLPTYQREYRGNRYPDGHRQAQLHSDHYRYQPREEFVRNQYQQTREGGRQQQRQDRMYREREGLDAQQREDIRRSNPREANREQRLDPQGQGKRPDSYSGG